MVTPPVGAGDVFSASAGPGHFPTIETLLKVTREAGGRTVVVIAQPARAAQMPVDVLIHLPPTSRGPRGLEVSEQSHLRNGSPL